MVSDLTKRLRNMYSKWSLSSCGPVILVEAADEIERLTRELAEAREALLGSMGLIDRMMHVHVAPDECTSYVEGSRRWFSVNGGSLAAIAEQQAINRVALKEKP